MAKKTAAVVDSPTPITTPRVSKDRLTFLLPPLQRWINDNAKRKLAVKSRRIGMTYAEAYDAVSSRKTKRRDWDYWYTSTDKDGAREFIEYCQFFTGLKNAIAEEVLRYETPEGEEECWSFVIRPTETTKIVAMPSRPAALRGKSGDVGADEFAFHLQPEELYKAGVSVAKWKGSYRAWSTHNGDASLFAVFEGNCRRLLLAMGREPDKESGQPLAEIEAQARAMRMRPILSYHFCNVFRAIDEGFVELYNRITGSTHTRESFLQECRDECMSDAHFDQEYGGRPASMAGQWLSLMLLSACEHSDCPMLGEDLKGYTGGPCYVGVDFARSGDYTVIWVLERVGDVFWTRLVKRIKNMDTPHQADELAAILNRIKFVVCSHDSTGNGLGLYEYTAKRFGHGRIHGVHFGESVVVGKRGDKDLTIPVRVSMATALKTILEERRMRLPPGDDVIRNELLKLKASYTASGQLTFTAASNKNGHADHFWAAALAISGALAQRTVPFVWRGVGKRMARGVMG